MKKLLVGFFFLGSAYGKDADETNVSKILEPPKVMALTTPFDSTAVDSFISLGGFDHWFGPVNFNKSVPMDPEKAPGFTRAQHISPGIFARFEKYYKTGGVLLAFHHRFYMHNSLNKAAHTYDDLELGVIHGGKLAASGDGAEIGWIFGPRFADSKWLPAVSFYFDQSRVEYSATREMDNVSQNLHLTSDIFAAHLKFALATFFRIDKVGFSVAPVGFMPLYAFGTSSGGGDSKSILKRKLDHKSHAGAGLELALGVNL